MRTIRIDEAGETKEVPIDIGRHLISTGAAKAATAQVDLPSDPVADKPEPEPDKPVSRRRGAQHEGPNPTVS